MKFETNPGNGYGFFMVWSWRWQNIHFKDDENVWEMKVILHNVHVDKAQGQVWVFNIILCCLEDYGTTRFFAAWLQIMQDGLSLRKGKTSIVNQGNWKCKLGI